MFLEMCCAMKLRTGSGRSNFRRGGLGAEDGDAGLEVGRLDVGGQAPLEAGDEAGLELLDLAGAAVAGEDDLFAGLEEVVEGVEELLLDALLAGEELHVVDQQHVDVR
jgi:hypothetical protein